MKRTKIKQNTVNFQKWKKAVCSKACISKKNTTLYQICFLIVWIYIFEAKKGCKKKSLNKLSLPADLLKPPSNLLLTVPRR